MSTAKRLESDPSIDHQPSTTDLPASAGPGFVLAELEVAADIPRRVLFDGLRAMGFTAVSLATFGSFSDVEDDERDPVSEDERDLLSRTEGIYARFLGKLGHAIVPTHTDVLRWIEVSPVGFDAHRPIDAFSKTFFVPFVLESRTTYELRFIARKKLFPDAEAIAEALDGMGFDVHELIAIRSVGLLANVPEEEREAYSVWYGRATWERPLSAVTPEDPFYFSDVKKLPRGER